MLIDDIGSYLATAGIGTLGSSIFLGNMPDAPDNAIALYQYSGNAPELVGNLESPRLTVRVRNTGYSAGMEKAQDILDALHTLADQTIGGTRYLYVRATGSVNHLGRDNDNSALFTIDFIVAKELES